MKDKELYEKIYKYVSPLETLFIYGTKADNLQEIMNMLKQESEDEENIGYLFEINPELLDKLLLIPAYKESNSMLIERRDDTISEYFRYGVSQQDYEIIEMYLEKLDDEILLWKYDVDTLVLKRLKEKYHLFLRKDPTAKIIRNPDTLLQNIFRYFSTKFKELDNFEELDKDNDIIHFKHITITKSKIDSIKEKIENIKRYRSYKQFLKEKVKQEGLDDDFLEKISKEEVGKLIIEDLEKHYYMPVIISKEDKIDYIKHIIKVPSEHKFLQDLKKIKASSINTIGGIFLN